MKSKIVLNFLLFALVTGFSGCQNVAVTENQSKIKSNLIDTSTHIKLKWLAQWYGEGKKENLIREIAREFTLLHQDIEIEIEFPHQMAKTDVNGAFSKTADTIANMINQNEWPYDIMLCDSYLYKQVADSIGNPDWGNEYLVNFIDQDWFLDAHKENLFQSKQTTDIFSGIAPGAYIEGIWNLLYLSSEVENRLGINVKKQNMSMSDFTSYAKKVFDYNKSHTDKITFLSVPLIQITSFFNQIALSALNKKTTFNKEESIEALRHAYFALENLAQYKPMEQYYTYKDTKMLYHDKALFIYSASWINLIWQQSNPEGTKKMHPCEIPSIDNCQAASYSGQYQAIFVVPKNSKNRKQAEMLMKFIASQETAEKWTKYSKCPTGLKNMISYSDFGTDEFTKFSQHIKQKYNDNLDDVNLAIRLFNSNKTIDFQIIKVMQGQISANDALNSVLRQINAI